MKHQEFARCVLSVGGDGQQKPPKRKVPTDDKPKKK